MDGVTLNFHMVVYMVYLLFMKLSQTFGLIKFRAKSPSSTQSSDYLNHPAKASYSYMSVSHEERVLEFGKRMGMAPS